MLIDSHCHLDMRDFDRDREAVIRRAQQDGIVHIISIGIDVKSSRSAIDLARKYNFISATVGCHPHDADECSSLDLETLASMAADPEVVAWGEIGLDYYRNHSEKENQRKIFQAQLDLAHAANLPVIIHEREAHEEVYAML
ncbi:MAG: TatD family hydrolase, partial [Deltaproteobacteria bacterium]|nr:TatD family hydrolase [Deltaproteobacteria bacterium]